MLIMLQYRNPNIAGVLGSLNRPPAVASSPSTDVSSIEAAKDGFRRVGCPVQLWMAGSNEESDEQCDTDRR